MRRLLPFLLLSLPVFGQVPVQNPSFEQFNTLSYGTYNLGPIPGWMLNGTGGSFQPDASIGLATPCDGSKTIVFLNKGASLMQDLGTLAVWAVRKGLIDDK